MLPNLYALSIHAVMIQGGKCSEPIQLPGEPPRTTSTTDMIEKIQKEIVRITEDVCYTDDIAKDLLVDIKEALKSPHPTSTSTICIVNHLCSNREINFLRESGFPLLSASYRLTMGINGKWGVEVCVGCRSRASEWTHPIIRKTHVLNHLEDVSAGVEAHRLHVKKTNRMLSSLPGLKKKGTFALVKKWSADALSIGWEELHAVGKAGEPQLLFIPQYSPIRPEYENCALQIIDKNTRLQSLYTSITLENLGDETNPDVEEFNTLVAELIKLDAQYHRLVNSIAPNDWFRQQQTDFPDDWPIQTKAKLLLKMIRTQFEVTLESMLSDPTSEIGLLHKEEYEEADLFGRNEEAGRSGLKRMRDPL